MKTLKRRKEEIENKIKAMWKAMDDDPNFDYDRHEDTYNGYLEELAEVKYQIRLNECGYISMSGVPHYN